MKIQHKPRAKLGAKKNLRRAKAKRSIAENIPKVNPNSHSRLDRESRSSVKLRMTFGGLDLARGVLTKLLRNQFHRKLHFYVPVLITGVERVYLFRRGEAFI